jgi:hypothetical protein
LLAAGHPSSQFPQNFDPEPENIMKVSMFANYLNNLSIVFFLNVFEMQCKTAENSSKSNSYELLSSNISNTY